MAQININNDVQDPFYRYKMPKIVGKVEGRGNGIKTVLNNIVEVSKSLNVPPDYPTKYLGIELGAQVIIDTKKDKFVINGVHTDSKLLELLYEFINRYLICTMCKNPETYLVVVPKNNKIKQCCNACGHSSILTHPHRFDSYIIKHPPKSSEKKPEKVPKKQEKGQENTDSVNPAQKTNGSTESKADFSASVTKEQNNETQWFSDISEEAVRKRMEALTGRAVELTMNDDLEKSVRKRLDILVEFIKQSQKNASPDWIDKVCNEARRLDLTDEAIVAIADILFQTGDIMKVILDNKNVISKLVHSKQAEKNLIASVEMVIAKDPETLIERVPKIFLCLYELELVQEETFIEWSQKKSKKYIGDSNLTDRIHKSAFPFINWLKTAEEESSSEDDEIEFVEDEPKEMDEIAVPNRYAPEIKVSDDDFNIDDI